MKKSMLVIGLGNFGTHLAENLIKLGNDIMVIDQDEKLISEFQEKFNPNNSWFGDCTSEMAIRKLGIKNFDICFVTVGVNLQASLQITSHLKKAGAKFIVSKATNDLQGELLKSAGADVIVNPEAEIAFDMAKRYTYENVFDYVQVGDGFALVDMNPPKSWLGKTIVEMDVRRKYQINIYAVKRKDGITIVPGPDYIFSKGDILKIVGSQSSINKLKL